MENHGSEGKPRSGQMWAEEADKGVVVVAGTRALAAMGDRITLNAQTVDTLTSQLARLELEGQQLAQEATKEKASLKQR